MRRTSANLFCCSPAPSGAWASSPSRKPWSPIGPLLFLGLRFLLAAIVVAPFAWRERRRADRPVRRARCGGFLACGAALFVGMAVAADRPADDERDEFRLSDRAVRRLHAAARRRVDPPPAASRRLAGGRLGTLRHLVAERRRACVAPPRRPADDLLRARLLPCRSRWSASTRQERTSARPSFVQFSVCAVLGLLAAALSEPVELDTRSAGALPRNPLCRRLFERPRLQPPGHRPALHHSVAGSHLPFDRGVVRGDFRRGSCSARAWTPRGLSAASSFSRRSSPSRSVPALKIRQDAAKSG